MLLNQIKYPEPGILLDSLKLKEKIFFNILNPTLDKNYYSVVFDTESFVKNIKPVYINTEVEKVDIFSTQELDELKSDKSNSLSFFSESEPLNFFKNLKKTEEKNLENISFDINFLIQKKSFINSFTENLQFYSYKIISYMLYDSIYKDDVDIYDRVYISSIFVPRAFNFVFAILADKFYFLFMLNLPLFNYFFKNVFNFSDFNVLILHNPEYFFIFENNLMYFYKFYFSNIYPSIFLLNIDESFLTPIFSILQFFSLMFFVTLYMLLYFIYFNYINKEDTILDHDFLATNVTIEAEEEIGSMDDILMSLVILLFLFLWFF